MSRMSGDAASARSALLPRQKAPPGSARAGHRRGPMPIHLRTAPQVRSWSRPFRGWAHRKCSAQPSCTWKEHALPWRSRCCVELDQVGVPHVLCRRIARRGHRKPLSILSSGLAAARRAYGRSRLPAAYGARRRRARSYRDVRLALEETRSHGDAQWPARLRRARAASSAFAVNLPRRVHLPRRRFSSLW